VYDTKELSKIRVETSISLPASILCHFQSAIPELLVKCSAVKTNAFYINTVASNVQNTTV